MNKKPENKYFLSNNTKIMSSDMRISNDFLGSWTINVIEEIDNSKPKGQAIQTLLLGDLIEYTDNELSYRPDGTYIAPVIGKVCEIKEKEVLLLKPNKERFMMGNGSQFVNYTAFHFSQHSQVMSRTSNLRKISAIAVILFIVISILLFIGFMIF